MTMRITLDGQSFELTPELVRSRLEGHAPENIRNYWVDIDGIRWPVKQVISLATGVEDRKRFRSQFSRRWLESLGFAIGSENAASVQGRPSSRATISSPPPTIHPGRNPDNESPAGVEIGSVLDRLRDDASSNNLADVLATGGRGLKSPGMYSWWVDVAGAEDLSRGLGHPVEPGLIYAGLAGATRNGGSKSSNTLWGRIATMHLGKKRQFSTLRRSLGGILAAAHGQPTIDEVELSTWMYAHLRVVTIPVADPDTLNDLESALLAELDPPLNLAKVPKTPLRQKLSALRKQFGTEEANA
ncbi:hypothetical protein GGQ54_002271 [Naumannella cuiyingiana]|uniref:GIY-YIG catalytic domain-containing protein n=1 Tax=Naumannella cuiyingiana TaxID=1347891 RepID=A0A7Z0D9Z9_9ACTN|nr:hypothetical protein [Naumannella cuiyingiana]NYI71711.1 hypothetical protein [Naumannella cuiyingiana]